MDLTIIDELKVKLEQEPDIHAMWIVGSVAEGYADELSDVDIWLDIDDGTDKGVFTSIEKLIAKKGKIDVNFSEGITPPFSHAVYHLAGSSPLHFIEVTLHSHSHKFGQFDSLRKIKVIFDKDDTTKFEDFDEVGYNKMLSERKTFLVEKIEIGKLSVEKEIMRQQFPDAMHNYLFWLVEPIIELARIKYSPLKITYNLKHASRDLPKEVVKEIESLYQVASLDDLHSKIDQVDSMLKKYK
ncbi:MAG TPA: nucleotidyltransferase domain-containing protein [Candidatus Saccharibacteria bacterium]|nr:nucleotidyltransferase domain-containing protein [Candidatus Saccharibacteria bacterium]